MSERNPFMINKFVYHKTKAETPIKSKHCSWQIRCCIIKHLVNTAQKKEVNEK
jgi:hypothetical protein